MSIRYKIIGLFLLVTLPTLVVGLFAIVRFVKVEKPLEIEIPNQLSKMSTDFQLQTVSEKILYYDEVLTQSARNYAFTENIKWKDIYETTVPKLDEIIVMVMDRGDLGDKEIFGKINEANIELVKMETAALKLVDEGNHNEAVKILESDLYWKQKNIYKLGLEEFNQRRGFEFTKSTMESTQLLDKTILDVETDIDWTVATIPALILLAFGLAVMLGLMASGRVTHPIIELKRMAAKMAEGDLEVKVNTESKDEIGELSEAFNKMAEEIRQAKDEIEAKVASRTSELQKVNSYMVGREMKMIELKKKIKELEKKNETK